MTALRRLTAAFRRPTPATEELPAVADPTARTDPAAASDLSAEPLPAFDPGRTDWCQHTGLCENCQDRPTERVKAVFSGAMIACISLCTECIASGDLSALDYTTMMGRASHHARHLGIPGTEVLMAMMMARRGDPVTIVGDVPVGPFNRQPPKTLRWVLSGGYSKSTVEPEAIEKWFRAALGDAHLTVGDAEHDALRAITEAGPEVAEVVAGWIRRANERVHPRPTPFDPEALTRAQQHVEQDEAVLAERHRRTRTYLGDRTA